MLCRKYDIFLLEKQPIDYNFVVLCIGIVKRSLFMILLYLDLTYVAKNKVNFTCPFTKVEKNLEKPFL